MLGEGMGKFIHPKLRKEVSLKLEKISGNYDAREIRKIVVERELRNLGDIYSFWIENPALRQSLLLGNKKSETIKKMARKGIHNIHNAWYFLTQKGQGQDFVSVLSPEILIRTNSLIEPRNAYSGAFRPKRVTLGLRGPGIEDPYTPPSPDKVPMKIDEAICRIKQTYFLDSFEAGILSHLEFAAIQPFAEGNKRTARLIQDRILRDCDLPPSIIPAGEETFYHELLSRTLPFYERGEVEGQVEFFNYCASKVNNALDDILYDLKV